MAKTIVMGVIGADVHAVGNRILEYAFQEAGFRVINLGVMVAQEEYIKAAIEADADAILVSSLYGHAELDCQGFKDKCIEAGLGQLPLYIGGNIVVGKQDFNEVKGKFEDLGFDYIYPPGTLPEVVIADLHETLGE